MGCVAIIIPAALFLPSIVVRTPRMPWPTLIHAALRAGGFRSDTPVDEWTQIVLNGRTEIEINASYIRRLKPLAYDAYEHILPAATPAGSRELTLLRFILRSFGRDKGNAGRTARSWQTFENIDMGYYFPIAAALRQDARAFIPSLSVARAESLVEIMRSALSSLTSRTSSVPTPTADEVNAAFAFARTEDSALAHAIQSRSYPSCRLAVERLILAGVVPVTALGTMTLPELTTAVWNFAIPAALILESVPPAVDEIIND